MQKVGNLFYLTNSDLEQLKNKIINSENYVCPILKVKIEKEDCAFDHKHITLKDKKDKKLGDEGKGLLRGLIHFMANTFEGKVIKGFKRSGLEKEGFDLPEILRNLADYIENPPLEQIYVHPKEKPKKRTLTQIEYQRICKYYFEIFPRKRSLPKYPKSEKNNMTKNWIQLLNKVNDLHFSKSKPKINRIR